MPLQYESAPIVLHGFNLIDWMVSPTGDVGGFTNAPTDRTSIDINSQYLSGSYRTLRTPWVVLPSDTSDFVVGEEQWISNEIDSESFSGPKLFNKRWDGDSVVRCWLTGWRLNARAGIQSTGKWRGSVSTSVKTIDPTLNKFAIMIEGLGPTQALQPNVPAVGVQWLAYPRSLPGVASGQLEFPLAVSAQKTSVFGSATWEAGKFSKAPLVWVGLSGFDYEHPHEAEKDRAVRIGVRVTNQSARGFDWEIFTWRENGVYNGRINMARFTWIAFESDKASLTSQSEEAFAIPT